jgi:hypothetical protein
MIDEKGRMVYNGNMFNTQHVLYMVISGILTAGLLCLAWRFATSDRSRNFILKFSAVITVVIHYSSLWVDYFASGGSAQVENNMILPVYPCNVVMWMLLIAAFTENKRSLPFRMLSDFCFYVGTVCGIIGIAFNVNFGNTPTLADYDILKGMLSHSTMLFGCIYMRVGKFMKVRMFNIVSIVTGLAIFILCGVAVNQLYEHFGMEPPDGMFLKSNPYTDVSPITLGIIAIAFLFCFLALWELRLPREERWYAKLHSRN